MKFIFYYFLFLMCFSLCSANNIGISPEQLNFSLSLNQEQCKNLTISSDSTLVLSVFDKWSRDKSKNLAYYNLNSQDLNLNVKYQKVLGISGKQQFEVCIKTTKSGIYYGAILFQGGNFGIGTWINVNSGYYSLITGNFLGNSGNSSLLVLVIFLLIILILLLIVYYLRKKLSI